MPPRLKWVDFAKGVTIILVVVAHAIQENPAVIVFIYVFHMPFFFVMAGYLLNVEKWGKNFSQFATKLTKRLLLPYFAANFLFSPLWFVFCYRFEIFAIYYWAERAPLEVLISIFVGNSETFGTKLLLYPLWFLSCLFFAELIFLKLHNFKAAFLFSAVGYILGKNFQLPLGIDIALFAQFFLFAGSWIKQNNFLDKINFPACVILLLTVFIIPLLNDFVTMDKRIYGNPFLFYVGGIAGTLFIMKVSAWLANFSNRICNFIEYCGKQTVIILVLHIPLFAVVYNLFGDLKLMVICAVLLPVFIAKNFVGKPILKYFCT